MTLRPSVLRGNRVADRNEPPGSSAWRDQIGRQPFRCSCAATNTKYHRPAPDDRARPPPIVVANHRASRWILSHRRPFVSAMRLSYRPVEGAAGKTDHVPVLQFFHCDLELPLHGNLVVQDRFCKRNRKGQSKVACPEPLRLGPSVVVKTVGCAAPEIRFSARTARNANERTCAKRYGNELDLGKAAGWSA